MSSIFDFLYNVFVDDAFRNALVLAGVLVAAHSIRTARAIARKKQSADVLFAMRGDERMAEGTGCIAKNHEAPDANMNRLAKTENFNSEDAKKIRYTLNFYETISVGIQEGIYDEMMFKRVTCGSVIGAYDRTISLILAIRAETKRDTIFSEFEWLAKRWKANPLKVTNRS